MGKDASISDWHRQKRKKEQQKNKATRIAARDAKVKEEKTVREVQMEIRKLEKQYKNIETMPHNIKGKLDRLRKELKLVKEEEEKKPKQTHQQKHQQQQSSFQPLENPAVSVYYDPVMNPYGAPPPGQPRLYHRRGGGTTMNLSEAVVPGQEDVMPPPNEKAPREPPFPPRRQQESRELNKKPPFSTKSLPPPLPPPPPPSHSKQEHPPPPENPALPPDSDVADVSKQKTKPTKPKGKKIDLSRPPKLPPPSAAVVRLKKKRGLAADIWASTEELEYEEEAGIGNLEGVLEEKEKQNDQWWYQDQAGNIQGPFTTEQILQWCQAGFFPHMTLARPSPRASWKSLSQIKAFQSAFEEIHQAECHTMEPVMNSQRHPGEEVTVGSSIEDRIAALRQEREQEEEDSHAIDSSVEHRIAALRQKKLIEQMPNGNERASVEDRIATLRKTKLQEEGKAIESIGGVQGTSETVPPLPPPPPPPSKGDNFPSYPVEDAPAYPVGDAGPPLASYPAAESFSYPVEGSMQDIPYPVDDAYPAADSYPMDAVTDEYPATDAYPATSEDYAAASAYPTESEALESPRVQPPKKKYKADKDLVSLLPSHIQKSRSGRMTDHSNTSTLKTEKAPVLEKDDLD